ncbi:MAG TPA: M48 family metalloprotease [Candidatus Sulfotelmatobacter sp.]|nr:M48 family metalloprotease [Candidatus Sulfotelmatobacter sp.]
MRMLRWISGLGFFSVFLFCSVATTAQDSSPSSAKAALSSDAAPPAAAQPAISPIDSPALGPAQTADTPPPAATLNDVMDRVVQREHYFMAQMRHMHPMIETYVQDLKNDAAGNTQPVKDQYFLGRLDMSDGPEDTSFVGQPGFGHRMLSKLTGVYSLHYLPMGFAQMVVLDSDFQKRFYKFTFVRREFLGEVRCLVIDVQPREGEKTVRFLGRIWVEDQNYNIVRFNGTYYPQPKINFFFHFDSWRLNMRPGTWLPAYVYTEESNLKTGLTKTLHFKAQTRLWGYDLKGLNKNEEFTQILVDSAESVKDQSDAAADPSPVMAQRMWERQAEENAVERMQKIGLLAPPGEVDKILSTVVNNLLVTNNIDLQSDFHCRVLLTAPLESFTIGHTIVMSRGLLDVLPDEAALAMVLAHEVSHIILGHPFDTKLAFNDKLFFPDEESFQRLDFKQNAADEQAADTKALELLKNSPYKDKLGNAGLFLRALQEHAPELPKLIRPHLGNGLASDKSIRMSNLLATAPQLDEKRLDQIAALPLGGRIKVDPWSDLAELSKAKPVALTSSREKMEFEITPFFPYITRLSTGAEKVALTTTGKPAANQPK